LLTPKVRKKMVFCKKNNNRVIKNLSPSSEKCNKGKERVDDNDDSIKTVLSSEQDYVVFSLEKMDNLMLSKITMVPNHPSLLQVLMEGMEIQS
jgi:hypothetical protein